MGIGDGLLAKFGKDAVKTRDEIIFAIKEQKVLWFITPDEDISALLFMFGESRLGLRIDKPTFDPSLGLSSYEYSRAHYSLHFSKRNDDKYQIYTSGILLSEFS